jgi:hypothetical protein
VQLHLLGQPDPVEEEIGQAVAAAGPRLDLEADGVAVGRGPELDLPGLQVAPEGGEPERGRRPVGHHHRAVPGAGHADHELVPDGQRPLSPSGLAEHGHLDRGGPVGLAQQLAHQLLGGEAAALDADPVAAPEQRPGAVLESLEPPVGQPAGQGRGQVPVG